MASHVACKQLWPLHEVVSKPASLSWHLTIHMSQACSLLPGRRLWRKVVEIAPSNPLVPLVLSPHCSSGTATQCDR